MDTITIGPPTKDGLAVEAQSWSARARGLAITDRESYLNASHLLRSIKGLRGQIQQWFEPHIEAAMETKRRADSARKALVDEKDRMEAPLVDAESVLKRALLAFEAEQERIRQAEEQRLQAEAQRRAEDTTLAVAAQLEMDGHAVGDAEMVQEAADILAQPIEAPVVSVAKLMPKVHGVTYRDHWQAHPEIDLKALAGDVASGRVPVTFLLPNTTAINQFGRATQGTQPVAGVRWWNNRQIATRG